jgi:hypothetical protein
MCARERFPRCQGRANTVLRNTRVKKMPPVERKVITKILALIVMLSGIAVMAGWIFNITALKSILPGWISMKFDTAIAFLFSGITLYSIASFLEKGSDLPQVILPIATLVIVMLMGVLFFSALFNIQTGAEEMFIRDTGYSATTVSPGRPSLPTILDFILIAFAGILVILNSANLRVKLKLVGFLVTLTGLLAVFGYIIGAPLLYYFLADRNSAMALHTAVLFILSGVGLLCL